MPGSSVPRYEDRILRDARWHFVELCGVDATLRRAREIASLPVVEWKGARLRTLRCHGTRGKGPHDVHVPESLLWQLIGLTRYRCVYHAGD